MAKKPLTAEQKRIMDELVKEHVVGREKTGNLVRARDRYIAGEKSAIEDIVKNMTFLADFYPKHIKKEDVGFFIPVMKHFTKEEQDAMLAEFYEFDRQFVHLVYKDIVAFWENR